MGGIIRSQVSTINNYLIASIDSFKKSSKPELVHYGKTYKT